MIIRRRLPYLPPNETQKDHEILQNGVRLLTGMDRNGPKWASITGMDLKIHPNIQCY